MTVAELIEELQKQPLYCPIKITRDGADIDQVRFEGNHIEILVDGQIELDDPDYEPGSAEYVLENIEAMICEANWKTGKKAELRELIEKITQEVTEFNDSK